MGNRDWMGPVRRWRKGDMYWSKNDFVTLVWCIDDVKANEKGSCVGIGPDGETIVGFMTAEQAKAWDGCGEVEPT